MPAEAGVDYPEERAVVDVRAESRDDVVLSFVEEVDGGELVMSVGQDRQQRRIRLEPGERLEIIWRGPEELRSLPAELVRVDADGGIRPTWRIRMAGPATRGQRRAAVRAPLVRPICLRVGEVEIPGTSLDISEGGARCVLRLPPPGDTGRMPEFTAGSVVFATVELESDQIACEAEIVRRIRRPDDAVELSLRFIGLGDRREDLIRRHVFRALRDLRDRGLL